MVSSIAQAQVGTPGSPGSRSLTIDECLMMVATETENEFEWSENPILKAIASRLWQASNAFEWKKAANAETISFQKYPYLLCHIGKETDANGMETTNMSGYRRKLALEAEIQSDDNLYLRALYNEDDYLCVYGQLFASVAANITGEDFIVQPIIPSLKYMKGSLHGMEKEIDFHNNNDDDDADEKYNPILDMVLCPGVAVANVNATDESMTTEGDWEELPMEEAREIIDMLVPTTIAAKLAASISDAYYLTSETYTNLMQDSGEDTTGRSQLWKDLIAEYQESGECDSTYSKRLKWTIQQARNPETDVSLLNVEFNTTGNSEHDVGCMLTLSLAIAAHPNVCSLESRERVSTQNTIIQWLTQSELEDKRPFFDVGLDGSGQVVALSDTGVDQNNCYFGDNGVQAGRRMNTAARKLAQYVDFVDDADYEYGHGTHVAGTIAGRRFDGPGMADGVAPGAKIAFADIGDSNGALRLPLDSQLLSTGFPDAKIHSASWGSNINAYTTQARNFDQYMFDNDEFLIVVAAGNSGHGDAAYTVGTPATAKNVIAVGAHHNTGKSRPSHGLGPSYIADFSSRGPTMDGRTKPDIIAPGKAVLSAGALPNVVGECDPGKVPGANSKSDGVLSLQGTSMATPVVSGTAAIIRQYFQEGYYPTGVKTESNIVDKPSGALIKAVLMNGAQWLKGVDNGGNGVTEIKQYDNNQNFGRLSLQDAVYLPGKTEVQLTAFDRQVVYDGSSQDYVITIDRSDGCAYDRLAVTLVWAEPGSSPYCTSCVLNDLDLKVKMGDGRTFGPNGLGGGPDRKNNAERVIIEGVKEGDVATITVEGYNLIRSYQHYSLVATGCFGGVANTNFVDQCSAFDCDDSKNKRLNTILMAIFIPLGILLLCGCGVFFKRRKEQQQQQGSPQQYNDEGEQQQQQGSSQQYNDEGY